MNTLQQIIVLLVGLAGLISAGIGIYVAVKERAKRFAAMTKEEQWKTLMSIADKVMQQVQKSKEAGATKKQMALSLIKTTAKASGINVDDFAEQLSAYIDDTKAFVKGMLG